MSPAAATRIIRYAANALGCEFAVVAETSTSATIDDISPTISMERCSVPASCFSAVATLSPTSSTLVSVVRYVSVSFPNSAPDWSDRSLNFASNSSDRSLNFASNLSERLVKSRSRLLYFLSRALMPSDSLLPESVVSCG